MSLSEAFRSVRPRHCAIAGGVLAAVLVCVGGVILHVDAARGEAANAKLAAQLGLSELSISNGEPVDLTAFLAPGKTTVFDFYSPYCGPCMALKPVLERLPNRRENTVLVEVNINRPGTEGIDWGSPVAQQYHLNSIPHLVIYGPDGNLIAQDGATTAPAREMVEQWLAQ